MYINISHAGLSSWISFCFDICPNQRLCHLSSQFPPNLSYILAVEWDLLGDPWWRRRFSWRRRALGWSVHLSQRPSSYDTGPGCLLPFRSLSDPVVLLAASPWDGGCLDYGLVALCLLAVVVATPMVILCRRMCNPKNISKLREILEDALGFEILGKNRARQVRFHSFMAQT